MNYTELKILLLNIPTILCRNMNHDFIKSILQDQEINISQQQYMVLKLLEKKHQLYVTEFVDILSITKPQMTSLIDKLILMGYVNRTNDNDDRRKIYISLTKAGKNITSKINNAINNQLDNHLIKLSEKELEALENGLVILQKLYSNCTNKN